MELYRVNGESPAWQRIAYDYIRTDAFVVGQGIPVEREFEGDGPAEDLEAVLLVEDHKPVAGLRITYPRGEFAQIQRVATVREKQRGGYGSILTAFYPGVLSYIQEEDQVCTLEAELDSGTVVLQTMKKYSPMDSLSDGLMLQFSMNDPDGGHIEVRFELSVTDGVFYRWDAIAGSYASAGLSLSVEGETIFWACPVPVADTVAPVMQIGVYATDDDRYLGRILFQLEVENSSYLISQAGFNTEVEETESQQTWDTGVATDAEATEKPQQ